jgi:hypothetical protein
MGLAKSERSLRFEGFNKNLVIPENAQRLSGTVKPTLSVAPASAAVPALRFASAGMTDGVDFGFACSPTKPAIGFVARRRRLAA